MGDSEAGSVKVPVAEIVEIAEKLGSLAAICEAVGIEMQTAAKAAQDYRKRMLAWTDQGGA